MPSSPILQAWAKTVGPSPSMCSLKAQAKASLGQHTSKGGLAHFQRITPYVVAVNRRRIMPASSAISRIMSPADWTFRHEADALSHRTREGKVLADRVSSG